MPRSHGPNGRGGIEILETAPGRHECLLRKILGFVFSAEPDVKESPHRALMPQHQPRKRRKIAIASFAKPLKIVVCLRLMITHAVQRAIVPLSPY